MLKQSTMMTNQLSQLNTPSLDGVSSEEKRQELKRYFENSWHTYEALFGLINNDEAYYLRPEPLRHPLIFYFGHTATFYINKLILGKYINQRVNERIEAICAVGVDEMSWDDLDSSHYDWPSVEDVRAYRRHVYQLVHDLIDQMPLTLPITQDSLAWIILMGCEHERIHLETSSVIMRMLPLKHLTANGSWNSCQDSATGVENTLVDIAGRAVCLGKKAQDLTYGWDNEYGQETQNLEDFKVSKYLVSNEEFLVFVKDGGYEKSQFWTQEGQAWLRFKQAKMPRFWLQKNGEYFQRNLLDEMPLPMNWPVEVNYLEAKAFCHWKSAQTQTNVRMPTESEWYRLREEVTGEVYEWNEAKGNVNLSYFASSCPVNRFQQGELFDVCGNVWQWTETPIDAFTGFSVHPLYDDFSTPTFDGKHNLIKGGSWISTGNETIISSRYAFRRHFFQHAGFRYVEASSQTLPQPSVNAFERDEKVCQQLHSHYVLPTSDNFSTQLAYQVVEWVGEFAAKTDKLLHAGCSVGRASFDMSPSFTQIDAVDFTARYIQFGVQLQQNEAVRFQSVNLGEIVDFHEVSLTSLSLPNHNNIQFSQADCVNLKPIFNNYDVVVLQQVLEKSYDPKAVLSNIKKRLKVGGLLIVASNYVFDEIHCKKENWLCGIKKNGENVTGRDGLAQQLQPAFKLCDAKMIQNSIALNAMQCLTEHIDVTVWQYQGEEC